jgi:hypothetical protein
MLSLDIYLQGGSGKNGPNMGKNNGKMGKNGNTNGQTPENRVKHFIFFKLIMRNQNIFIFSALLPQDGGGGGGDGGQDDVS